MTEQETNLKYYIDDAIAEAADRNNIEDILKEFEDLENQQDPNVNFNFEASYEQDLIFAKMNNYEINFTVRQLQNICDYYKISCKKMKKPELIAAIVDFENNPENSLIIMKRQKLWYYMEHLREDSFMKKFIVFW
jgi:hypothetical protein